MWTCVGCRERVVRCFLEWLDSPSDDLMCRTNEPMVYRLCSKVSRWIGAVGVSSSINGWSACSEQCQASSHAPSWWERGQWRELTRSGHAFLQAGDGRLRPVAGKLPHCGAWAIAIGHQWSPSQHCRFSAPIDSNRIQKRGMVRFRKRWRV